MASGCSFNRDQSRFQYDSSLELNNYNETNKPEIFITIYNSDESALSVISFLKTIFIPQKNK